MQLNGSWIHALTVSHSQAAAIDKAPSRNYCIQDPMALLSMGSGGRSLEARDGSDMVLRRGCLAAPVATGELLFVLMAPRIWVRPRGIGKRPVGRCLSWQLASEY